MHDDTHTPSSPPSPTAETRQPLPTSGFASTSSTASSAAAYAVAPPTRRRIQVCTVVHDGGGEEKRTGKEEEERDDFHQLRPSAAQRRGEGDDEGHPHLRRAALPQPLPPTALQRRAPLPVSYPTAKPSGESVYTSFVAPQERTDGASAVAAVQQQQQQPRSSSSQGTAAFSAILSYSTDSHSNGISSNRSATFPQAAAPPPSTEASTSTTATSITATSAVLHHAPCATAAWSAGQFTPAHRLPARPPTSLSRICVGSDGSDGCAEPTGLLANPQRRLSLSSAVAPGGRGSGGRTGRRAPPPQLLLSVSSDSIPPYSATRMLRQAMATITIATAAIAYPREHDAVRGGAATTAEGSSMPNDGAPTSSSPEAQSAESCEWSTCATLSRRSSSVSPAENARRGETAEATDRPRPQKIQTTTAAAAPAAVAFAAGRGRGGQVGGASPAVCPLHTEAPTTRRSAAMGSSPLSAIEVTTSPITTTAAVGTTPGPSAVKSNNARATTRATAAQRRALTRLERGVCGLSKPEWHPMGLLSPTAPPRRPSSATAGRPSLRGEGADGAAEASELSFYERALLEAAKAMSSI